MKDLGNIHFIGGGNMGSCLVGGLIQKGYSPNKIKVADHGEQTCNNLSKQWGIDTTTHNAEIVQDADILVLAVKPQTLKAVLNEIATVFNQQKTLLISIAAGIQTNQIQAWINQPNLAMVRAMPNTPALYGFGMTGLYTTHPLREKAKALFDCVGETVWIENESLMDVVTALSGSGPAYFFYVIENLIKSAMELGLPEEIARKLTIHTALGSAQMAHRSTDTVEKLRENVTSPGGTTAAGIQVLKDGKLATLIADTLKAASERSKTLSEQYD